VGAFPTLLVISPVTMPPSRRCMLGGVACALQEQLRATIVSLEADKAKAAADAAAAEVSFGGGGGREPLCCGPPTRVVVSALRAFCSLASALLTRSTRCLGCAPCMVVPSAHALCFGVLAGPGASQEQLKSVVADAEVDKAKLSSDVAALQVRRCMWWGMPSAPSPSPVSPLPSSQPAHRENYVSVCLFLWLAQEAKGALAQELAALQVCVVGLL
jgi:hypothetical protein